MYSCLQYVILYQFIWDHVTMGTKIFLEEYLNISYYAGEKEIQIDSLFSTFSFSFVLYIHDLNVLA